MKEKDTLATFLFDLPRTGKNIIAKWGNEDLQETYKKYGHGDRMNLIWYNGKFNKGDIFWKQIFTERLVIAYFHLYLHHETTESIRY
ncbi:hypothetical protein [Flavivirga algicola]|uniref:Uncharacterized protein n=1 Tax=Flavivirga algicola TaxID=2729136 RepID=A0ABX1S5A5_9FLAO|nr:hypothetical protein [Flavivirga algicola]NMH89614.1 hypothetical protein [Flavivirga algicola]